MARIMHTIVDPPRTNPLTRPPMVTINTFIVEDSVVILDKLVLALEDLAPVKVVGTAPDEDGAVRWLTAHPARVDLVIIDIFLQQGTGLGVLERTRQQGLLFKRVVLTNYATAEMRSRCLALGADRVFDKSNELDELVQYCVNVADGTDSRPAALA
jgi:DNA-binding NarL/FixJ family response regulator